LGEQFRAVVGEGRGEEERVYSKSHSEVEGRGWGGGVKLQTSNVKRET
jgi:hypothetical protein